MKKVVAVVVGTRPEVIKMAPVWFALNLRPNIRPLLVSSGQHREMLDQAFNVFGLKPDVDLGLMQPSQSPAELTSRVITNMSKLLKERQPSAILVQGDTTTVLGAALAAFYEKIPIGHVEAGLRTYDFSAPWPEEMNRRLADSISRWCFAPTERSAANLLAERIPSQAVHVTGNTVIDALLWVREKLTRSDYSVEALSGRLRISPEFGRVFLKDANRRIVLITGHRRESFGAGFESICQSIALLAARYPDTGFIYPVHLNPNVQEPVTRILGNNPRVSLIPPLGYEDFIWLLNRSHLVLTDSGGVQEEAPSLGKPVLVMRDTTERPEGVDTGTCRLVGTSEDAILREASLLLDDEEEYRRRSRIRNPYGDGTAAGKIIDILEREISQ